MQGIELVTFSKAAEMAGISEPTLRKRMRLGTAPDWQRVGREIVFAASEVKAWAKVNYPVGRPRKGKKKA